MRFGKDDVLKLLDELKVEYEIAEHEAAYTLDEMMALNLPRRDSVAKNLFLRDDKKQNYYLLTLAEGKRADLKKLREILKTRPLKFASEEELERIMCLKKGSVTPLGILNDSESRVEVLIDRAYEDGIIGVHPNDNRATVWLHTEDLIRLISRRGNRVSYIDI